MEVKHDEKMPNNAKFKELILFICERSEGDPNFGATKLNKLLFYSDFFAYLKLGKAITGQPYQKLEWGPAPRYLKPILAEMYESMEAVQAERDRFGKKQKVTLAVREAKLDSFSADEIALVTDLIEELREHNASDISNLSHKFVGWEAAEIGEEIPYETAFFSKPSPSNALKKRAAELEGLAQECLSRGAS